jgi:hypothetical protein
LSNEKSGYEQAKGRRRREERTRREREERIAKLVSTLNSGIQREGTREREKGSLDRSGSTQG